MKYVAWINDAETQAMDVGELRVLRKLAMVGDETPVRPEGLTEWSTVQSVLAAEAPEQTVQQPAEVALKSQSLPFTDVVAQSGKSLAADVVLLVVICVVVFCVVGALILVLHR